SRQSCAMLIAARRYMVARIKYHSPALVIRRHRQLRLCVGLSSRRNDREFASTILDGPIFELIILTFLVELDTGSHTYFVDNVGRPDCLDQRFWIGAARTLERIGRDKKSLERIKVLFVHVDVRIRLGQRPNQMLR